MDFIFSDQWPDPGKRIFGQFNPFNWKFVQMEYRTCVTRAKPYFSWADLAGHIRNSIKIPLSSPALCLHSGQCRSKKIIIYFAVAKPNLISRWSPPQASSSESVCVRETACHLWKRQTETDRRSGRENLFWTVTAEQSNSSTPNTHYYCL